MPAMRLLNENRIVSPRRAKSLQDSGYEEPDPAILIVVDHRGGDKPAAVRISLIGFDARQEQALSLDGHPVGEIHSDLTGPNVGVKGVDLTKALCLKENLGIAFMGDTKGGPFDMHGDQAREWLALP